MQCVAHSFLEHTEPFNAKARLPFGEAGFWSCDLMFLINGSTSEN